MKPLFPSSFAALGLICALSGLTLAGCNRGDAGSTGGATLTGAATGSSSDTLATVGTVKVTRADLSALLEAQGGQQALPILIDTQLVFEALKAKSLEVSDAEVDTEFARRQAKDPQLAAQIATGGALIPLLKVSLKREIAVQRLLTAGITPTEAQVKAFFEKNHSYYDTPEKVKVGILFASTKVRADLLASQLKNKSKTFEALVAEQKKALDPIASQSIASRTNFDSLETFPPPVRAQLLKLPKGGTTTPVSLNLGLPSPVFLIFRKVDFQPLKKADFTAIRADVEADYKSAQIAAKTAAKNPQNPKFDETLKRTFDAIKNGNQQVPPNPNVTLHDALNSINQYAASELMQGLRSGGTVQIQDPAYTKVATAYQAPTAPGTADNAASSNAASGNAASGNAASGNAAPGAPAENAAPVGNAAS